MMIEQSPPVAHKLIGPKEEFFSSLPWLFILRLYVEDKAQAQVAMVLPLGISNWHGYYHNVKILVDDEVLE
jgi:hypothetical protein